MPLSGVVEDTSGGAPSPQLTCHIPSPHSRTPWSLPIHFCHQWCHQAATLIVDPGTEGTTVTAACWQAGSPQHAAASPVLTPREGMWRQQHMEQVVSISRAWKIGVCGEHSTFHLLQPCAQRFGG